MVHSCVVHTERAETAAVSRGISHATMKQCCKYTTSVDIQKRAVKENIITHLESHPTRAQSVLESGESRYIKAVNNNNKV